MFSYTIVEFYLTLRVLMDIFTKIGEFSIVLIVNSLFSPASHGSIAILRQHALTLTLTLTCIPSICRTYSKSSIGYTTARDYHVADAE